MRIDRILFPTDFSECAERVYSHAAHFAARYDAELHVLNVAQSDVQSGNDPMGFLDLEPENGTTLSHAVARGEVSEDVLVVHSRMTAASPVDGILEYASTHDIDLIVMGTHGRTGVDYLLSGSVAEDVVRHARCPILSARCVGEGGWKDQVQRILVPVDFSEHGQISIALEIARAYGAEIDIVHVIEEAVLPTIYGIEPFSPGAAVQRDGTEQALWKLLEGEDTEGLTIRVHVQIGNPTRRILDFAEDEGSDLIVLSSHGRTGVARILLGSVAEKVVRLADVPVFTNKVKSDQG